MDIITYRTSIPPIPLRKKLNPIWWFGNDFEEQLPDWYHSDWPGWRRELYWTYFRNPLQNFRAVVLGIADKNFTVAGRSPLCVQRDDLDPPRYGWDGWQWNVCYGGDLWIPRPFVSYSGKVVVWYIGWQPSGFFGVKLIIHGDHYY